MKRSIPLLWHSQSGGTTGLLLTLLAVIGFAVACISWEYTHSNTLAASKGNKSFPGTGTAHASTVEASSSSGSSDSGKSSHHHKKGKHKATASA